MIYQSIDNFELEVKRLWEEVTKVDHFPLSSKSEFGLKQGLGEERYENGDIYVGELQDSLKNGNGVLFMMQTGEVQKGNFINDKLEGSGIQWFQDGLIIEGYFKDGKLMNDQKAKVKYSNGELYDGGWRYGR